MSKKLFFKKQINFINFDHQFGQKDNKLRWNRTFWGKSSSSRKQLLGVRKGIKFAYVISECPLIDAHCEATIGWLEPLAQKIKDNPKTIVIPSIDGIDDRSIAFHGSVVSKILCIITYPKSFYVSPAISHIYYGTCAIITCPWFETALDHKPEIFWRISFFIT